MQDRLWNLHFWLRAEFRLLSWAFLQIARSRIVDQSACLGKAGAVAGAVPGPLIWIPFQCAAQMRTSPGGRRQQADSCFQHICCQLQAQDCSGRRKHFFIRILFSLHKIAQNHCRSHGRCHPPFIKPGGNI